MERAFRHLYPLEIEDPDDELPSRDESTKRTSVEEVPQLEVEGTQTAISIPLRRSERIRAKNIHVPKHMLMLLAILSYVCEWSGATPIGMIGESADVISNINFGIAGIVLIVFMGKLIKGWGRLFVMDESIPSSFLQTTQPDLFWNSDEDISTREMFSGRPSELPLRQLAGEIYDAYDGRRLFRFVAVALYEYCERSPQKRNSDTELLHCGYIIERLDNPVLQTNRANEKPRARSCDSARSRTKLIASFLSFGMGLQSAQASRFNISNASSALSNEEFLVVILLILTMVGLFIICIMELCRRVGRNQPARELRVIPCSLHWQPVEAVPEEVNLVAPPSSSGDTRNRPKLNTFGPPLKRTRLSVSSTALIVLLNLSPAVAGHPGELDSRETNLGWPFYLILFAIFILLEDPHDNWIEIDYDVKCSMS